MGNQDLFVEFLIVDDVRLEFLVVWKVHKDYCGFLSTLGTLDIERDELD